MLSPPPGAWLPPGSSAASLAQAQQQQMPLPLQQPKQPARGAFASAMGLDRQLSIALTIHEMIANDEDPGLIFEEAEAKALANGDGRPAGNPGFGGMGIPGDPVILLTTAQAAAAFAASTSGGGSSCDTRAPASAAAAAPPRRHSCSSLWSGGSLETLCAWGRPRRMLPG